MTNRPTSITSAVVAVLLVAATSTACAGSRQQRRPEGDRSRRPSGARMKEVWRWVPPRDASLGMPTADSGAVAVTYNHTYLALVGAHGGLLWEARRLGLRDVAPRLATDLVLAATDEGLAAFDRRSGAMRWDVDLGDRASAPSLTGDRAVVALRHGVLAAIALADGRVLWRTPLPGRALGPPAIEGGVTVATWDDSGAAGITAVHDADGRPRWSAGVAAGGVSGALATRGGLVVVVAGDAAAHAFSLDDGTPRWRVRVGGAGSPEVPPIQVDRRVLVADRQGTLRLLAADRGDEVQRVTGTGAAVRGGPVGPGPSGGFALPQWDGTVLVTKPGGGTETLRPPGGLAAGVAAGPGRVLVVAIAQGVAGRLIAYQGW